MTIGFTGTRDGLRDIQYESLYKVVSELREHFDTTIDGMCIGADAQFNKIVYELRTFFIKGYPGHSAHDPNDLSFRSSYIDPYNEIRESKPFLDRNKDIVDDCDLLIGCPMGAEILRSGTWSTIRYARKGKRVNVVVMPDGTVHDSRYFPDMLDYIGGYEESGELF